MSETNRSFCDFCSQPIAGAVQPTKSGGICCDDCASSSHFERRMLQEMTALVRCIEHLASNISGKR